MASAFQRISNWFVPAGLSADDALRGRFFVNANLAIAPLLAIALVAYAWNGAWGQSGATLLMAVASVASLAWYRRSGNLTKPFRLSLAAAGLMFASAALAQTPADITNVCFLAVIPLLSALNLSPAETKRWTLGVIALGAAILIAADGGLTVAYTDPHPLFSAGFNFLMMVLVLAGFARVYAEASTRAFHEAQSADRAKSTFLATISHEIRTPMNGVIGLTEAMLTEPMAPSQRENLLVVQRSGKLLVSLINDLLDVTKAEAGKLSIDHHDFDLTRLLDDVRALFEPAAHAKALKLRFELDPSAPTALRGDSMRLNQVLNNLVNNAVKFTEAGEVRVRVRSVGPGQVHFEIGDTGIGITPEQLPRLFTAFEQGDGSTTRRFGGTGLGLALAQQLVTLMGGHIEVASARGQGTRFGFTLTFEPGARQRVELTPPTGLTFIRSTQQVLVVDDNPINLAVAAQLVEKAGFRALKASSAREALEVLAAHPIKLVLMDCHMPDVDGFEATERIRALKSEVAQVPIVALTASTLPEDLAQCRRSGMNEVLIKPVSLNALTALLQRLLAVAA